MDGEEVFCGTYESPAYASHCRYYGARFPVQFRVLGDRPRRSRRSRPYHARTLLRRSKPSNAVQARPHPPWRSMALCIPQPLHYHCTCGVDLSQAVFLAAIPEVRLCWSVCPRAAYVFLGALCMEIPFVQVGAQILCCIGVCLQDRIPRHRGREVYRSHILWRSIGFPPFWFDILDTSSKNAEEAASMYLSHIL